MATRGKSASESEEEINRTLQKRLRNRTRFTSPLVLGGIGGGLAGFVAGAVVFFLIGYLDSETVTREELASAVATVDANIDGISGQSIDSQEAINELDRMISSIRDAAVTPEDLKADYQAWAGVYVLSNATKDNTPTELFLDGVGERLAVSAGRALAFDMMIIGRTSGGLLVHKTRVGSIENTAGTTRLLFLSGGDPKGEIVDADVVVEADDANDALVVKVTGAGATAVRWVAVVRTAEVSGG